LILYQKIYDFMLYFFPIVDRFPKYEKFALQTQLKNTVYKMLRLTIEVQKSKNKTRHLYEIDKELEFLKSLIAFSNEKRPQYLTAQKRKTISEKLIEIGKIVGGMVKKYGNSL